VGDVSFRCGNRATPQRYPYCIFLGSFKQQPVHLSVSYGVFLSFAATRAPSDSNRNLYSSFSAPFCVHHANKVYVAGLKRNLL